VQFFNLDDLKYTESPEDLGEITFNSLISIKFKLSLNTQMNIRFHAEFIPLDVIVDGNLHEESQLLAKKHSFGSTQFKGPFSERDIYFTVDLANNLAPVLPGRYILNIFFTAQERLTVVEQSSIHSYEFDIQKEHVFFKANAAESEGKGSIYSFECPTSPGWNTVFNTTMVDSVGNPVSGLVTLSLSEPQDGSFPYKELTDYHVGLDGIIYSKTFHTYFLEDSMRGKILFNGDQSLFYKTTTYIEVAQLNGNDFSNPPYSYREGPQYNGTTNNYFENITNSRIERVSQSSSIEVSDINMNADGLKFQLKNFYDNSWSSNYGTRYENWNSQTFSVSSGLPYILREGRLQRSGISSATLLSGLSQYNNLRMNYGVTRTVDNMVSTNAELSQFATGQDFNNPQDFQDPYQNSIIDSVWVEETDKSSTIDFSSDMDDYSGLINSISSVADGILPSTVVNTVAYQPEIIDVSVIGLTPIIKDKLGGTPTQNDMIQILNSKEDYLRVYESDADNADNPLFIEATFKLDHNEDFESIEYILLSTSFAHEIDTKSPGSSYHDRGFFATGVYDNTISFSLLDNNLSPLTSFKDVNDETNFQATNIITWDPDDYHRILKTYNFGESIYSDIISDGGDYYKPSNDPSKANFLYTDSGFNFIDEGAFTRENNVIEFYFAYEEKGSGSPWDKDNHHEENHIYDYNYLRVDTSSITESFVSNGEFTVRASLDGYPLDMFPHSDVNLEHNDFILRNLNVTVFSNKDNLNSQNWDFSGDGYTLQDIDGGLVLNSGSISLDDTNYPDKSYIDSNSDTKYRAVYRLQETRDIVTFSVGSASYIYNPLHPNTKSLQEGINTIEITYDTANSFRFFVNGEDGTGILDGLFNPSAFNPSGDFYPQISVDNDDEIKLFEIKNQVFEKIDANYNGWSTDYSDSEELVNVGGIGETHNDLTYSDISLQREIIYSFNDGLSNLDAVFDDLRLWSDLDYYTNTNEVSQQQYDPDFPLFISNIYGDDESSGYFYTESSNTFPISLSLPFEFDLDFDFPNFAPSMPENIYILKIQPRFYFKYDSGTDASIIVRLSNGLYLNTPLDNPYIVDGRIHQYDGSYNYILSNLPVYSPSTSESAHDQTFNYGFTYTDDLELGTTTIKIENFFGDLDIYTMKYIVYTTPKPNTFKDHLYNQEFDIHFDDLTEFYILGNDNEKRLISNSANFSSTDSNIKTLLEEANNSISSFDEIIYKNSFGENALSFNIKANINYPDFADEAETIRAFNTINNFSIVPKLKPTEGKGLSEPDPNNPSPYPYATSWWHQQELVLPLPFNLEFNDFDPQDFNDFSELIFNVKLNLNQSGFNNFAWRPNIKIYDHVNDKWLPYIGTISSGDITLWNYETDYISNGTYDKIQLYHSPRNYFQILNGSSHSSTFSFQITRNAYPNLDLLLRPVNSSAYITLLAEVYLIPGVSVSNDSWNLEFENNEFPFTRKEIVSSLVLKESYIRRFLKTDIIKKNVYNSNYFYQFKPFLKPENSYLDLNSLLGESFVNEIAEILNVYGIDTVPKIINENYWKFNRTEGRLYLPSDAMLKYDEFNFTMTLWSQFAPLGNNRFEPDKILFENITLIEKVVGVRYDGSIQWFTKSFESGTLSNIVKEPFYISLNEDSSINSITFAPHVNLSEFSKIMGVVHHIGESNNSLHKEKIELVHINHLRFPFNFSISDDEKFLELTLDGSFLSGFKADESINNIRQNSYYSISISFYKAENGRFDSNIQGRDYIGTYDLANNTKIFGKREFQLSRINLLDSGLNQTRLNKAFQTEKTLILLFKSNFSGLHQGSRLNGEFIFSMEDAYLNIHIVNGNYNEASEFAVSPEFTHDFLISNSSKLKAVSFLVNYTTIPEVNIYLPPPIRTVKDVNALDIEIYNPKLDSWIPVIYVVNGLGDRNPFTFSYTIDYHTTNLDQFDLLVHNGSVYRLKYRFRIDESHINSFPCIRVKLEIRNFEIEILHRPHDNYDFNLSDPIEPITSFLSEPPFNPNNVSIHFQKNTINVNDLYDGIGNIVNFTLTSSNGTQLKNHSISLKSGNYYLKTILWNESTQSYITKFENIYDLITYSDNIFDFKLSSNYVIDNNLNWELKRNDYYAFVKHASQRGPLGLTFYLQNDTKMSLNLSNSSPFANLIKDKQKNGMFVKILIPNLYSSYCTIDELNIVFKDFDDNTFIYQMNSFDFDKYFKETSQYLRIIPQIGEFLEIPIYIDFARLINFDNPGIIFNISQIETVNFVINDALIWPGKFPYQIFGITEISFYDILADNSPLDILFNDFNCDIVPSNGSLRIEKLNSVITDLEVFNQGDKLSFTELNKVKFSDSLDVFFRFNNLSEKNPLYDIISPSMVLFDDRSKMILGISLLRWDESASKYLCKFTIAEDIMENNAENYRLKLLFFPTKIEEETYSTETISIDLIPQIVSKIWIDNDGEVRVNIDNSFSLNTKFELNFEEELHLNGFVLDNSTYYQNRERISFPSTDIVSNSFQSEHLLNLNGLIGDSEFIDKNNFKIEFIDKLNSNKITPLFEIINGSATNFVPNIITDCWIKYYPYSSRNYPNKFTLVINWNFENSHLKPYDDLLISYKINQGKKIYPAIFEDNEQQVIPIDFWKFDYSTFEWVQYITEEVNPVKHLILEFLDLDNVWKPIEKISIQSSGDFDHRFFMGEGGFQFPLNQRTFMRLVYLPTVLTTYNNQDTFVDYSNINSVYDTNHPVSELFILIVKGKKSKLSFIPTDFSKGLDRWAIIPERKYETTTDPSEALLEDEMYTYLDLHRTITDNYEFQFQLIDEEGNPIPDQIIFYEIGWKPKAGLNYKLIDWRGEEGEYLDSESLGTGWFMDQGEKVYRGPGIIDPDYSLSRMFTRPEVWEYIDVETGNKEYYSSYEYNYVISNTDGLISFNISFDENYIADHNKIFGNSLFSSGSINFDSLDDYRLYIRVFHAPIMDIENMAFQNASKIYCSTDNNVFDLSRIDELDNYDFEKTKFYSGSYATGLITLHPEDIMLGVPDLLIHQLGSELNESFSFEVEVTEADPLPDTELMPMNKLTDILEDKDLIPEFNAHSYLINQMPIVMTITDFYGKSPFYEGNVEFIQYVGQDGKVTFNVSDYYLQQLDPGLYKINLVNVPSEYTKNAYRFCTLESRSKNWLKFGKPALTLDLLDWYKLGWSNINTSSNNIILDHFGADDNSILIPIQENNKTSLSFNFLALLYESIIKGSFYLDDLVLSGDVKDLKPVIATLTFTTENGESYFDNVTIDPSSNKSRFDFEVSLQLIYAIHGYTTFDIKIDFTSSGTNSNLLPYIIFDKFELTADDRIIQTVDKPILTKKGDLNIIKTINTAQFAQIFTDRLDQEYNIIDNTWLTITVEGFGNYSDLVRLYRDDNRELQFENVQNNEWYFQSLPENDRRLVDSLGLHLNVYNLELPEYLEGEINIYAGKDKHNDSALLDTKHFFVEIQPREMKFYNNYYPFSGGSIISPFYCNLSANYQYQLAMNYRLQEKALLMTTIDIEPKDIQNDHLTYNFGYDKPIQDYDNTPVVVAYFYNEANEKIDIPEDFIVCDFSTIIVNNISSIFELTDLNSIEISLIPELHNKYQPFYNIDVNLAEDSVIFTNWTVAQDPKNNLIANFEAPYFIYDINPYEIMSKGMVKQLYAILNNTNYLTYYLTEDLNDPINGWADYDTLIMKLGFLNLEVLDYLELSFYYENGGKHLVGSVNITLDMIDTESGTINIKLPNSYDFRHFTVRNNAHIVFKPIFYSSTDFQGNFYENGYPYNQMVEWNSNDVVNGFLNVDLDSRIVTEDSTVVVFNDLRENLYEVSDVSTEIIEYDNGEPTKGFSITQDCILLPEVFMDTSGNTIKMRDEDLLFLKYNALLEKTIGITVEDMILQKKPYFSNYLTGNEDVPFAEISLLGLNNDGINWDIDDIFENRDKLVAWESPLDLTPFASVGENTYKQQIYNISFEDIDSNFKVMDSNNVENSFFTEIMITSNDPRYEIVVDSVFLFEFEKDATLYDSTIFDIYPNNHIESFYFGDYSDIYSESILLDTSSFEPLYHNDNTQDEMSYFDVFDNVGNYYYFESQLNGRKVSSGIYDITWNPFYSEDYYNAYQNQDSELKNLYEFYNPHIDKFRHLYVSWADNYAWNEWHTIEQENINISSLEVEFDSYNTDLGTYQSIFYDQSLNEFEARNIAVETIYPHNFNERTVTFDLSQDYGNAQELDILMIKGYYFNESEEMFSLNLAQIKTDKKSIQITAPPGLKLNNFEKIIVYLEFTNGANSDYTQFRLMQEAIDNHPEAPVWTKNDSVYVNFEYNDVDYFVLLEDFAVGSEDSSFEYFEYVRNDMFITRENSFIKRSKAPNFQDFNKVEDPSSVLELYDYDLDANHEFVVQKDDLTGDGVFDSFKYGEVNPAGEITFHTLIQEAESVKVYKDKTINTQISEQYQINWQNIWRQYYIYAQKISTTHTTSFNTVYSRGKLIQKDLNGDGSPDKEVLFRMTTSITELVTVTNETTHLHFKPTIHNPFGREHDGYLSELRNSTTILGKSSISFMFKDFQNEEVNSTRYYLDVFPNELSEQANLDNYLVSASTALNNQDSEDAINKEIPLLEGLISLSHERDGIPAVFDQISVYENGTFTTENILAVNRSISIPGIYNQITGLDSSDEKTVSVIEVIPSEGVYYDINTRFGPEKIPGKYYYLDENNDGQFSTILVSDSNDNIIGIGFDNDQNSIFEPNKRALVEKHIVRSSSQGWFEFGLQSYTNQELIYFQDKDSHDGYFLEPTFTDSYFDIWKMQYTEGTSKLIKEAMTITSNHFVQSVKGRILEDISWQIQAQATSAIVGGILSGIVTVLSGGTAIALSKVLYYAGHFLTYAICNAIHSYIEDRDQDYWLRSQTFHNIHYEGTEKLSDKLTMDNYYGDMMTGVLWGSGDGIYAPVRVETDKKSYEGQVILAPRGELKTDFNIFTLDISYKELLLNYPLQTRGYFSYSDFNDPRFISFFYKEKRQFVSDAFGNIRIKSEIVPRNDKNMYMTNSIMFLEDSIHNMTLDNEDTHYDSIVPYMVYGDGTFVPMLQFADSQGQVPIPEFYDEYPIFVSPEHYAALQDNFYSIYKIYDSNYDTVQLIPKSSARTLHSDVVSFDVYLCDSEGNEKFIGNYNNSQLHQSFSFNKSSGSISFNVFTQNTLNSLLENYEGVEPYIVLEFYIEKYRSINDLRDLTEEEVNKIAIMQSAHAGILEYIYQHTIATKTQQKLSELAYTVLVTTASILPLAIGAGFAKSWTTLPKMIVGEVLEEILIDPWVEAYVSGYADEHSWSRLEKALGVSFAESGRETFGSFVSSGLRSVFSIQTSQNLQTQSQSQAQSVQSAQQLKNERDSAVTQIVSQLALSSLMLFAGAMSPILSVFGSYTSSIGMGVIKYVQKVSYKKILGKVIDSRSKANVQNLITILGSSREISDSQTSIINQELSPTITKEFSSLTKEQKSYGKSEKLLQKTYEWVKTHKKQIAMYAGLAVGGVFVFKGVESLLKGLNELSRKMILSTTMLGLGTIGIQKTRHKIIKPQPVTIDDLLISVIEQYKNKISKFVNKEISINTRTNTELMKIHSNRKLYNWAGIIYKITLKKDPLSGDDLFAPGYGRYIIGYTGKSILQRWDGYLSDAMTNKRTGALYQIIKLLVNHPHKSVADYFKFEILEVGWDLNQIAAREDHWINHFDARNPAVGFNIIGGGSGFIRINLPIEGLIRYIAKGYWVKDMPALFMRDYGIKIGAGAIRKRIYDFYGSFDKAQRQYLKPILEQFIRYGFQAKDIYKKFPGFILNSLKKPTDKISYLCTKYWNKNYITLRKIWLKEGIDYYLKRGMGGAQMLPFLPGTTESTINNYIQIYYGSLDNARLVLIKPILQYLLKKGLSDQQIVKKLDWSVIYINSYPFIGVEIVQYFTKKFWNIEPDIARLEFHDLRIGQ